MKIKCRFCNSNDIIKYGHRFCKFQKVQVYLCKFCERKFSFGSRSKFTKDLKQKALNYSKDHSLRKTKKYIEKKFKVKISHVTIFNWKNN